MNLLRFLSLVPLVAAGSCLLATKPPNILFILADDLGYTDINAFAEKSTGGSKDQMFYETPNIDRLAAHRLPLRLHRQMARRRPWRARLSAP